MNNVLSACVYFICGIIFPYKKICQKPIILATDFHGKIRENQCKSVANKLVKFHILAKKENWSILNVKCHAGYSNLSRWAQNCYLTGFLFWALMNTGSILCNGLQFWALLVGFLSWHTTFSVMRKRYPDFGSFGVIRAGRCQILREISEQRFCSKLPKFKKSTKSLLSTCVQMRL